MLFRKPSLTERLIELIPELDIHIIPDNGLNGRFAAKHREIMRLPTLSILDLIKKRAAPYFGYTYRIFVLSFGIYGSQHYNALYFGR